MLLEKEHFEKEKLYKCNDIHALCELEFCTLLEYQWA